MQKRGIKGIENGSAKRHKKGSRKAYSLNNCASSAGVDASEAADDDEEREAGCLAEPMMKGLARCALKDATGSGLVKMSAGCSSVLIHCGAMMPAWICSRRKC